MEQETLELNFTDPACIIETAEKVQVDDGVTDEQIQLIYKAPRLFRKSLIYKTFELFGSKLEYEPKVNRPLKEK